MSYSAASHHSGAHRPYKHSNKVDLPGSANGCQRKPKALRSLLLSSSQRLFSIFSSKLIAAEELTPVT